MIKRLSHAWTLALGVLSLCALSSCDSAKKTNYLQDIEIAKAYGVKHDTGIVVQKGDKLRILVTSIRNPELTVPFNTRQVAQGYVCSSRGYGAYRPSVQRCQCHA